MIKQSFVTVPYMTLCYEMGQDVGLIFVMGFLSPFRISFSDRTLNTATNSPFIILSS
jgi:hypothetical protein